MIPEKRSTQCKKEDDMIEEQLSRAGYTAVKTNTAGVTVWCMDEGRQPHCLLWIGSEAAAGVSLADMLQQTREELGGPVLLLFEGEAVYRRIIEANAEQVGLQLVPMGIYTAQSFMTNQEALFQRMGIIRALYGQMGNERIGGWRGLFGRVGFLTLVLLGVNVVLFFLTNGHGQLNDLRYLVEHGGLLSPFLPYGTGWKSLFTAMFLHADIVHLGTNMVALYLIGNALELRIGSLRFLSVYMLGGLGANLVSAVYHALQPIPVVSLGASGAVFALLGAYLLMSMMEHSDDRDGRLSRLLRLGLAAVLALSGGFTRPNTDNAAHIGGFFCGMLVMWLLVLLHRLRKKKEV